MSTPVSFAMPRRALSVLAAALFALALTVNPLSAGRADAAVSAAVAYKAAAVTSHQVGVKYRLGGTTPRSGFDCSGLTRYAYAKVGKRLPRTAQQQYAVAHKISKRSARVGDLVFFHSGRSVYHVAVYAGHGYIWHAPKPGKRVAKVKLWTSKVTYGRVR